MHNESGVIRSARGASGLHGASVMHNESGVIRSARGASGLHGALNDFPNKSKLDGYPFGTIIYPAPAGRIYCAAQYVRRYPVDETGN